MKRPAPGQPPKNAKEYNKVVVTNLSHMVLTDTRAKAKSEGGGYVRDLYLVDSENVCLHIELQAQWTGKLKFSIA